jgi:hypothetical protein
MDENQVQESEVVETTETTETVEAKDAGAETVSSLLGNADEGADEVAESAEQVAEEVEYVADDYDAAQAIEGDVDAESFGRFNELAKGLKLTKTQADELAKSMHAELAQSMQRQHVATLKQWEEFTIADGEIGGDKLNESVRYANSAIKKYGTPELEAILKSTPLGSHPEIIRMLSKVGRSISEPQVKGETAKPEWTPASLYSKSNMK